MWCLEINHWFSDYYISYLLFFKQLREKGAYNLVSKRYEMVILFFNSKGYK